MAATTSVSLSNSLLLSTKLHSRSYHHHPNHPRVRRISFFPNFFFGKKGKYGSWSSEHLLTVSSSEGGINEHTEESKFVPLNADDPVYGPPALLLIGFDKSETQKVFQLLKDLDGEFLKVIHCTEDMLSLSVWEAMHVEVEQPNLENVKVVESLPRMCILSGLSGEEMLMFIDAFPEAGFEPAIFAALVPNSANKFLHEVVEEIKDDHETMSARQQSDG